MDKFRACSDCDGELERRFTKDALLTNITLYWVTGSVNSSLLFYCESQRGAIAQPRMRIGVPVGLALFPKETPSPGLATGSKRRTTSSGGRRYRGGHFPAAEEPERLATELRELLRPFR